VGGIPEIVQDQVNGYLVPPRQPEALGRALLSLLEDRSRAQQMGMAGRAIVEHGFSIDAMVKGNMDLYAAVIKS